MKQAYILCILLSLYWSAYAQLDIAQISVDSEYLWEYDDIPIAWNMPGEVQVAFNEGLTALKENKYRAAIIGFHHAISLDPQFWPALYYRGVASKLQNQTNEARKDLLESIKINSRYPEALMELGKIELIDKKPFAAIEYFEKAKKLAKNPALPSTWIGNIHLQLSDLPKAEKHYKESLKLDSTFLTAKVKLAVIKILNSKNPDSAIGVLNQVLVADSTNRDALLLRGLIYLESNKPKSLKDFNTLVYNYPVNFFFRYIRGTLLVDANDFEGAFVDFRRVLHANQTDERNFKGFQTQMDKKLDLQFALSYAERNMFAFDERDILRIKKALSYYFVTKPHLGVDALREIKGYEKSPLCLFLIAVGLEHAALHEMAWEYYKNALKLDHDLLDAHKKSGIYYGNKGNWRSAEKEFTQAIEISPNQGVLHKLRGVSRFHIKDYEGAINDFTQVLKSDTSDNEALSSRAFAYEAMGDYTKAADDRVRMTNFNTLAFDLIHSSVLKLLEKGDTTSALKYLDRFTEDRRDVRVYIVKLDILMALNDWERIGPELEKVFMHVLVYGNNVRPDQLSYLHWVRGVRYLKNGKWKYAEESFTKALASNDENSWAYLDRGKLFLESGDYRKAKKDLQKAVALGQKEAETLLLQIPDN